MPCAARAATNQLSRPSLDRATVVFVAAMLPVEFLALSAAVTGEAALFALGKRPAALFLHEQAAVSAAVACPIEVVSCLGLLGDHLPADVQDLERLGLARHVGNAPPQQPQHAVVRECSLARGGVDFAEAGVHRYRRRNAVADGRDAWPFSWEASLEVGEVAAVTVRGWVVEQRGGALQLGLERVWVEVGRRDDFGQNLDHVRMLRLAPNVR
eukprot:scaffold118486_cov63-Phaeocystis_antarctica.AAC.3